MSFHVSWGPLPFPFSNMLSLFVDWKTSEFSGFFFPERITLPLGKPGELGSQQAVLLSKLSQAAPKKSAGPVLVHQSWVVKTGLSPMAHPGGHWCGGNMGLPQCSHSLASLWDGASTHWCCQLCPGWIKPGVQPLGPVGWTDRLFRS